MKILMGFIISLFLIVFYPFALAIMIFANIVDAFVKCGKLFKDYFKDVWRN